MRVALGVLIVVSSVGTAYADKLVSIHDVGLFNVLEDEEHGPGDPQHIIPIAASGPEGPSFNIGVDQLGVLQRAEGPDNPANPFHFFWRINNFESVRYVATPAEGAESISGIPYCDDDNSSPNGYVTSDLFSSDDPIAALEFTLDRFERFFISHNDPEYPESGYHRYEIEFTMKYLAAVPEPSALSLFCFALVAAAKHRRRWIGIDS